jgi:hypothetical protein
VNRYYRVQVALGVAGFVAGCAWLFFAGPSLDRAQAKFEREDGTGWDWEGWHRTKLLKCHDIRTLRICEARMPLFAPGDNKPFGHDVVKFACSTEECMWVDP